MKTKINFSVQILNDNSSELATRVEKQLNILDDNTVIQYHEGQLRLNPVWLYYLNDSCLGSKSSPHLFVGNISVKFPKNDVTDCGFEFNGAQLPFNRMALNVFEYRPMQYLHICGDCSPTCNKMLYITTPEFMDQFDMKLELVIGAEDVYFIPPIYPPVFRGKVEQIEIEKDNIWYRYCGLITKVPPPGGCFIDQ